MSDATREATSPGAQTPSAGAAAPPAPIAVVRNGRWTALAIAVAVPALLFFFLPPLSQSGLWDPYELNVADLSRRIALNLYKASNLALQGADNSLPHLNDLGRPQLPFSSIALGFKLFGLHEWAGRLPLAIWGFLGVLATYAFVARLFDRRTGVYAAVVLSTMPLYFVQARSILGDVCAMAALAMAFGGLVVATFDREPATVGAGSDDALRPPPILQRVPWLAMGLAGLFVGFESRGGLLGLGVPLLSVGLSWLVSRLSAPTGDPDRLGDVIGCSSLVGGLGALAMGVMAVATSSHDLDPWLGALAHAPSKYPTFDYYVAAIAHSLAPWSAFVPFAFGRMLVTPATPARALRGQLERESLGRMAVLMGAAVAFVVHAYMVATTDLIAFTGPALCAVACAVAIRDFERSGRASVAIGLGTLLLSAVLHHDFHEFPDKAYQAFGIASAQFPEGFKNTALNLWWIVLGGFALSALITWIEYDETRTPFAPDTYAKAWRTVGELYDGVLALTYLAALAGLSLAGLLVFVGSRTHAHWLPQMSSTVRDLLLNAWWVVGVVPLVAIFGLIFVCDLWAWTFERSRSFSSASVTRGFEPFEDLFFQLWPPRAKRDLDPERWWSGTLVVAPLMLLAIPAVAYEIAIAAGVRSLPAALIAVPSGVAFFLALGILGDVLRHRATAMALAGALVGFVLCFSYYPALANQLSPKEVFESYRRICHDAPLALLGVGGRTSAYYAGGQPQGVSDPAGAFQWLTAGGDQRRCLALKADELPKLNQLWRERGPAPRTNLPVLDARSSQILLAASSLSPDEKSYNPLSDMVLSAPPHPQRKIGANMDDKLEVIGIDLLDERGRATDSVTPGRSYHFRTYYRVMAAVTTEWEAFIHIDGYHRRHNGDHKPMSGKYPMSLWLPGDVLADDSEFKLEPNFTPGTYTIYFGLYVGDTRLKVLSGPNDGDNRINGGPLRVQ
ncbi:MAG TPA: glycosyltransferase family 39 protein [Polyangiaceae bacterium]|nr:glycosyltransferase family 39 protein [Polyangiaceae bacterium]